MARCYSYCRVSTARQVDEGDSLANQQRQTAGYAVMHGWTVDEALVETGVSGSVPFAERPQGARLLSLLRKGDAVIAAKLDRAFRSASDALATFDRFKALGVSLHLLDLGGDVSSNGVAKLVFTVLSAVAEAERDRIRERIADVKGFQRSQGRYLGGSRPFGWSVAEDGRLVPDDREQDAIQRMQTLRSEGHSLRSIASRLNGEGFQLSHFGVRAALARR